MDTRQKHAATAPPETPKNLGVPPQPLNSAVQPNKFSEAKRAAARTTAKKELKTLCSEINLIIFFSSHFSSLFLPNETQYSIKEVFNALEKDVVIFSEH